MYVCMYVCKPPRILTPISFSSSYKPPKSSLFLNIKYSRRTLYYSKDELWASGYVHVVNFWFCS